VPGDLIAADSLNRIIATIGRLPLAVTGMFGFECRLGDTATTADFSCRVTRLHGGQAVLAGHTAAHALPPAWREHPIWDRVGQFCIAWDEPASALHAQVRELWLEFDIDDARTPSVPLPSVFFGPPAARGPAGYGWIAEQAIPLLRGDPLPSAVERTLRTFVDALPDGASVRHVGLMLPRLTDAVRLVVTNLPFDLLPTLLDRIGWPGAIGGAHSALSPTAQHVPTDKVMFSLDLGPSIVPRIGLECDVPAGSEWSWGRAVFFDNLVGEGLCLPVKRAALDAWGEWTYEPHMDAASVEQLAPLSELAGLPARGVFVPRLSHVKVSYQPDRPLEAKAYLAVQLRWKLL
jgi:hypothetical protein